MGQPALIEDQIAQVICRLRGGCGTAGTIANKLKLGVTAVRAVLDGMCRRGQMESIGGDGEEDSDVYRLVVHGRAIGALPPRIRANKPEVPADDAPGRDDDEGDDGDVAGMSLEHMQAERLWRVGMGDQRWRDDPRAMAEARSGKQFLPFSERH